MIMNKIYSLLLLFPLFVGLCSCEVYDSDDYPQEPAYEVACDSYNGYLYEIYNIAELSDFFQAYQQIKTDRVASLELGTRYFGYYLDDVLFYDEVSVYGWGDLLLQDDGSYTVTVYPEKSSETEFDVIVEPLEGRRFSISLKSDTYKDLIDFEAEVVCDDEYVSMESCFVKYWKDNVLCQISGIGGEPVKKTVCFAGGHTFQPEGGSLHFSLSGNVVDEFDLKFADSYVTIARDGSEVKCREFGRGCYSHHYDYVID